MTRRTPAQYNFDTLRFDETILTKHFTSQKSKNVKFIVIHHMVIKDKVKGQPDGLDACWRIWQTRKASAHYGVEDDFIRQYVWDKDYAWATGNTAGNRDGISIEHVNSTLDEPGTANDYKVSDKTWKNGAKLAAYLHKKYKLGRPVDGKTIRKHSSFKATSCPGPYLGGTIWKKYVAEAQRVYDEITGAVKPTPAPKPTSYTVKRGDTLGDISKRFGVSVANLAKWNGIKNVNVISVGQVLRLSATAPAPAPKPVKKPLAFWLGYWNVTSPSYKDSPGVWSKRGPKVGAFLRKEFAGCSIYGLGEVTLSSMTNTFKTAFGSSWRHSGSRLGNDTYDSKSKFKQNFHREYTGTFNGQTRGMTLTEYVRDGKTFNHVIVHGPNGDEKAKKAYAKWVANKIKNFNDPTYVAGDFNHEKHWTGSLANELTKIGFIISEVNSSIDKIATRGCKVTKVKRINVPKELSTHPAYQYRIEIP